MDERMDYTGVSYDEINIRSYSCSSFWFDLNWK